MTALYLSLGLWFVALVLVILLVVVLVSDDNTPFL